MQSSSALGNKKVKLYIAVRQKFFIIVCTLDIIGTQSKMRLLWAWYAPEGQKAVSPGQRPGYKHVCVNHALKGQKR